MGTRKLRVSGGTWAQVTGTDGGEVLQQVLRLHGGGRT